MSFIMPAEWEIQEAMWLSWPRRDSLSFADHYEQVIPAFGEMVRAFAEGQKVRINVGTPEQEAEVRAFLSGYAPAAAVEIFPLATNEPWCRDHGPIFVREKVSGSLHVLDWDYNAWGGKYPPYELDETLPSRVAAALGLPVHHPGLIMEGGSLEVNGAGTLLTTEACLLNPNRNPTKSRAEIEAALGHWLGAERVLWLGDGIVGDDTDGHIDDLTRFVGPRTVVTVVEPDRASPNHEILQENLRRLRTMRTAAGESLEIIELPCPAAIFDESGRPLPASYANFTISNAAVVLPVFGDAMDGRAAGILREVFPGRKVVPVNCREIIWGLGAVHCLTQQQPKG